MALMIFLSWCIYQRLTKTILEKQKVKNLFKVFVYLYITNIIIFFWHGFVSIVPSGTSLMTSIVNQFLTLFNKTISLLYHNC